VTEKLTQPRRGLLASRISPRSVDLRRSVLAAFVLAGCTGSGLPTASSTSALPAVVEPSATASPQPSPLPATSTASPTPDPYAGLTVADLKARAYGGGSLLVEDVLADTLAFTRYLVSYPSDGLQIYGFLDLPKGEGPFPVVLVLHGYIDPEVYQTLAYTTRYADFLAQAGYLTIHPNLRGYPPSESGPNLFRVGFAVDVLNLAAIVREAAGLPGPLERADGGAIGLLGHSMGGGIALRVVVVDPQVRGAVLYGSMSGNEQWNYTKILEWSEGARGAEELAVPAADVARIQAANYLEDIQASLSIHHGSADETVPPEWSADLCARLQGLEKPTECFVYPGAPHTFYGTTDHLFMERVSGFFASVFGVP
jgi:dienelactone hydrolase